VNLFFEIEMPGEWALVDGSGSVVDRGRVSDLDALPRGPRVTSLIAVVPGTEVITRRVAIPARSRSRAQAAARYALEEYVSADVDSLHFALLDWRRGAAATVAIVNRERMARWRERLVGAGLQVRTMVPDYLMLPLHPNRGITIARGTDARLRVRQGHCHGMTLDPEALDLWWREVNDPHVPVAVNAQGLAQQLVELGATQVSTWAIGDHLGDWLAATAQRPAGQVNLLQGDYPRIQPASNLRAYWPAAAMLLLAAAIKVGADAVEYVHLRSEHRTLNAQMQQVYLDTFPGSRVVAGRERELMKRKVEALQAGYVGGGDFPYLLGVVSQVVRPGGATLEELSFRDNTLTISCATGDFAGIERLKKEFEQVVGVQAELLSSGAREQQVSARFRLTRTET
jgi:general secretion pathway protein L